MSSSGRRRAGVLGGSFDPVHIGHLIIAEEARDRLGLDKVIFVPARQQWRKVAEGGAPPGDRLAMVLLAVAPHPGFRVATVDLDRPGPTYTVDTLADLHAQEGSETDLFFLMGEDALNDLPYWKDPAAIASAATLVAVSREGVELEWDRLGAVIPDARARVLKLDIPEIDISSTELRRRVAAGRSIRYWVPPEVEAYINERRLYRGKE